ncbi:hypothetical protein SeLEV6574_g02362 [Synchytrium endobioticum]|uniref:F-box domain-containing protein n=1 Tax=Synchytrium endobioticum TaxID=286115 RepID=A0A507D8J9_9FUNG|nr:hypothetical protein SeLEV6574_g02362 [Synchytrium endobioticum]
MAPHMPHQPMEINELPIDLFEYIMTFLTRDTRNLIPVMQLTHVPHGGMSPGTELSVHTTHLDMGLAPTPTPTRDRQPSASPLVLSPAGLSEQSYGRSWESRFVSPLLDLVAERCLNLQELNIAGAVFYEAAICDVLKACRHLQKLELGCSSIKAAGLSAVAEHGRSLRHLGLTGLFRFRRLSQELFVEIVNGCAALKVVVVRECPDLDAALLKEIVQDKGALTIVV